VLGGSDLSRPWDLQRQAGGLLIDKGYRGSEQRVILCSEDHLTIIERSGEEETRKREVETEVERIYANEPSSRLRFGTSLPLCVLRSRLEPIFERPGAFPFLITLFLNTL
jgi:hypothetical protein